MALILIQKDPANLIAKDVTTAQRAEWALDYTIYDVNADGSRGAAYGPTRARIDGGPLYVDDLGAQKVGPDGAAAPVSGDGNTLRERIIANRLLTADTYSTSYQQCMVWKKRRIFANVQRFRVAVTSSAIQGGNPRFGPTQPSTFQVAVMRPGDAAPIPVTFGGASSGTETLGQLLWSDWMSVPLEAGTDVWFGCFQDNPVGLTYVISGLSYLAGEANAIGASATNTITTGPGAGGIGSAYFADGIVAITGESTVPACLTFGDSIGRGQQDTGNAMGLAGMISRTVGAAMPELNMGAAGSQVNNWSASGFLTGMFSALFQLTDVAAMNCGTNDLFTGGRTATQVLSDMTTATTGVLARIQALSPGMRVWWCTVGPQTTSTDSWATVANQTVKAAESERISLNRSILGDSTALTRHANFGGGIDVTSSLESSVESGLWAPASTPDGTHPRTRAYARVESARYWDAMLRRVAATRY